MDCLGRESRRAVDLFFLQGATGCWTLAFGSVIVIADKREAHLRASVALAHGLPAFRHAKVGRSKHLTRGEIFRGATRCDFAPLLDVHHHP
jgi:hypothetical protein